jgi:hypothetical protein
LKYVRCISSVSIIHDFLEAAFLLVFIINSVAMIKSMREKFRFEKAANLSTITEEIYYSIMEIAL